MPLEVAGEALAAVADESHAAAQLTRLAAETSGAACSLLWDYGPDRGPSWSPRFASMSWTPPSAARAKPLSGRCADAARSSWRSFPTFPAGAEVSATLQLGQPPVAALQLLFERVNTPTEADLAVLATFGVRAAHALRLRARSRAISLELERTRALLAVVGQAISELSLAHTLETTVERVAELLGADRLAVYLREEDHLFAAAGTGLAGPHVQVAQRLLDLAHGPYRSHGVLVVPDVRSDARTTGVADAASEAGIEAAIAVPLLAREEVIGLLAVFPHGRSVPTDNESSLLAALAAQLAVAVQNAQLHEQAKLLGAEREQALDAERAASKQVRALYEISRSFAQSLSLSATLDALAATIVDVLDVDAAVIGMPDDRREWLVPRALKIAEPRLEAPMGPILNCEQPFGAQPVQRLFRLGEPFLLTPTTVQRIGGNAASLLPFLERGWTGAAIPIATSAEVLAALTIVSMRPGSP